jgi:hyperosmotically inducible protein
MKIKFLTVLVLALSLLAGACGKKDADIQKAAQDKLNSENVTGATVTVKDGVATLTGEVADITVKNKAETAVKGTDGVKSVTNNLTLKPLPTPVPAPADPMLKGKVEESLRKAGCTGVTVDTANGKITLTGTVPEAKYTTCFQAASQAGGSAIVNNLVKGK